MNSQQTDRRDKQDFRSERQDAGGESRHKGTPGDEERKQETEDGREVTVTPHERT